MTRCFHVVNLLVVPRKASSLPSCLPLGLKAARLEGGPRPYEGEAFERLPQILIAGACMSRVPHRTMFLYIPRSSTHTLTHSLVLFPTRP